MRKDMLGKRYGRMIVLAPAEKNPGNPNPRWLARCDCGTERIVFGYSLRAGHTQSCGCLSREKSSAMARLTNRSHGHATNGTVSRTYVSWRAMHQRCTDPNNSNYRYYGGRGVSVCARWLSFDLFVSDMGERPPGKTIDRIDVNGNYEPSNCRWATSVEQRRNQRRAA